MLDLQHKLVLDEDAIMSPNLAERFGKDDRAAIASAVWQGYERDKRSREKWERRNQAGMDLATQLQKSRNFPWPNCSNVAFPLVTIGALNFAVRAYPALIPGKDVVGCAVFGQDPDGSKQARANRISSHMSWQCLYQQPEWEEQKDRLLINLPIVGTTFTKSYWNVDENRKVDETVLAQDLVVDYWAKSLAACPRKTHVIPLFRNQLHSGMKREIYLDVSGESWYGQPPSNRAQGEAQARKDIRTGMHASETDDTTPYTSLEQHVDMDLDGDGYAEPYIITIEEESQSLLRIVTGFERPEDILRNRRKEVISISRSEYFTKYSFIPSPDGGFYDIGFGVLLGPLNEAVNSLINQMIDAGTLSITAGGFLGRGAKVRGGSLQFAPFQWHRVDSSGDDLRKSLVQLETREPSSVLFQLLGLLINYTERISGATDTQVGENPGQNTKVESMQIMTEEGRRVYSAVYKRVWRGMKEEFKKDYVLNGIYLPARRSFGSSQIALKEDYLGNPDEISPVADQNITSDRMAVSQAVALKQLSAGQPGFDPDEVNRRMLKAMKIENIDQVYPGIEKTGVPEDPKLQIQKLKAQVDMAWLDGEKWKFMAQLQEDYRVNTANIAKIAAEIENMKATTEGDAADRQIAIMNATLGAMSQRNDMILSQLEVVKKSLEVKRAEAESGIGGNVSGMAGSSGDGGSERAA